MKEVQGSDRVSIEKKAHSFYIEITKHSKSKPENSPFLLMKDVFMWAVALGVQQGERRPLEGRKEQIFRWDQFSKDIDVPVLKAVALAETEDIEVVLQDDEILRIAEEYANRGIVELKDLFNKSGANLWNLVNKIRITEDRT